MPSKMNSSPQPPKRPLLEVYAEQATVQSKDAAGADPAPDTDELMRQNNRNIAFSNMLLHMRDKRNGH